MTSITRVTSCPDDVLTRAIARARFRLVPFLLLMYVVAFLDRVNIGFAKQSFQSSTGLSESAFAWGAGLFFLSYALFEIPSNLILHRVGARIWMCRIMVTWGLISIATMFVRGPISFYVLRLSLGFAEAGFFPGVILYLTYWFPARVRSQILGQFYFGAPLAFIFGGPLSGLLLTLHGKAGLPGWQWMFLVEGSLAVVVGVWAFWYLADRPADARWLSRPEQAALHKVLQDEDERRRSHGPSAFLNALGSRRMYHFVAIYLLIQMSVYGVVFYLPTDVAVIMGQSMGPEVGIVSALPWVCALAAAYWVSRLADRWNLHRIVAASILGVSACASTMFLAPHGVFAMAAICVAASGFIAVQPLFWTFPTGYLSGRAAAGGIAAINALGALGGFVAPNIKVWADHHFHSEAAGLYVLAGFTVLAAGLIALLAEETPSQERTLPI
jgi:MFS family permease